MRRLTNHPLPPYTYVPGQSPHPVREPTGHSFGRPEPAVATFDPDRWHQCDAYLFGIDLFNERFYWESHEQWEAAWHAVGRDGTFADFLKGLIKLSAAGVKSIEGRPVGVARHLKRARELLEATEQRLDQRLCCGLDIAALIGRAKSVAAGEIAIDKLELHVET